MHSLLWIALGGAIGTLLRFLVTKMTVKVAGFPLFWGTIAVNLTGCFVIGLMWGIFNSFNSGHDIKLFVFVGILGAFTTFSTFALENFHLFKSGEIHLLAFNVVVSNIAGVLLVFTGFYISSLFISSVGK